MYINFEKKLSAARSKVKFGKPNEIAAKYASEYNFFLHQSY